MEFRKECIDEFKTLFDSNKDKIRGQKGCFELNLLQAQPNESIFFTYSLWQDQAALDSYRKSELFGEVWKNTKALFAEKAEAWSCSELARL